MQSRYYNPEMGRFINADEYASTGQGVLGHNMFAYCGNNPVSREDPSGDAFETAFDLASLVYSIAEVIDKPSDPWAWVGLAGDLIDVAVPFVTGVGEAAKAISFTAKAADAVDDAYDASKAVDMLGGICFVAGTLVCVEDGYEAIENIEADDYVWAWDEATGDVSLKRVVETYVNETSELIHVFVNGEEIISTPEHPFYSPVKGWTEAVQLRAGDILVLVNGEYVVVEKVQHEILEAPVTVYNFQVEDYHTYYVSTNGILVHNSCAHQSSSWSTIRRNYWKHQASIGGNDTWYELNPGNINRMKKGKAPIGWDREKVVLHHVKGISVDMYDFVEVGGKTHREFHKLYGYKNFIDIYLS